MIRDHWLRYRNICLYGMEYEGSWENLPKCFFFHDWSGSSSDWMPQIEQWDCPSFAFDLPGCGRSFTVEGNLLSYLEMADLWVKAVSRFISKGEPVVWVGKGLGGALAQILALEYSAFTSVVLIESFDLTQDLPKSVPRKIRKALSWPDFYGQKTWRKTLEKLSSPIYRYREGEVLLLPPHHVKSIERAL